MLPFALNFLISYGVNAGFVPQISIAQYVGFALWFLDGVRADFRSAVGHHTDGKTGMGRCAVSEAVLEVGVPGIVYHRRDSDPDAGPV